MRTGRGEYKKMVREYKKVMKGKKIIRMNAREYRKMVREYWKIVGDNRE